MCPVRGSQMSKRHPRRKPVVDYWDANVFRNSTLPASQVVAVPIVNTGTGMRRRPEAPRLSHASQTRNGWLEPEP